MRVPIGWHHPDENFMNKPMSMLLTALGDYIGQTRTIILFADGTPGGQPAILPLLIARHQNTEDRLLTLILEATRDRAAHEPTDGGDDGH